MNYTDEQIADYLELAAEVGITRAMRTLGYPKSWASGQKWVQRAGIEVPIDTIKAIAKAHHDWYTTEDMLVVAQEGISRVHMELQSTNLTPDEHKKMSEAFQKYANTWLLLQGKANNINEHRSTDSTDVELMNLLNDELSKNAQLDMEATQSLD